MALDDEERQRQRELLAAEEQAHRERAAKGIKEPVLGKKDRETLDRIVMLGAIAKQAARAKIAVPVMTEEGKPTTLEERIGNEDMIFMALLNTKLGDRPGEEEFGR